MLILSVLCLVRGFQMRSEKPYAEFQQIQVAAGANLHAAQSARQSELPLVDNLSMVFKVSDSYRVLGDSAKSIDWLKGAAQRISSEGELRAYEEVLIHLANVYAASGKFSEAIETYSLCFDMDKSAPDSAERVPFDLNNVGVAVGMRGLGVVSEAERQKQFDGAEKCFRTAMESVSSDRRAQVSAITRQNAQVLSLK